MAQNSGPNPKPSQYKTIHNKHSHDQSNLAPTLKVCDKRKRTVIAKRGYKVRVLNQPMPTNTAPMSATTSTSTQMQTTGFATTAISVAMHNLATGKFAEASSPIARPQNGGHPSGQNPPSLEDIPKTPVRQGAPWSNAGSTSENLFETQKDWPIPPTPVPIVKTEAPSQVAAIPRAMYASRQAAKIYRWGPHCPICKYEEGHEEDWDSKISQGCTPKTFILRLHKTLSCRTSNIHSHKPFKVKNRTFSSLSPSHNCKASSVPSQRTIKNHFMFQTGIPNR